MTDSNCRRWMLLSDREATGESLGEAERRWLEAHAASCKECGGEARLWSALGEVLERPELLETSVGPTSALAQRLTARRGTSLWRRGAQLGAAAACVALAVSLAIWIHARPKVAVTGSPATPMRFVSVAGEVRLGEKAVRAGDALGPGERLRTGQGRACISLEASILACLDAEGTLGLSTIEPGLVSLRLERGRLLSRLERQPKDRRYVVVTEKASVVAKGTEFVVAVDTAQRVSVHLHEGQLAILALAHQDRDIRAPSALAIDEHIADEEWSERVLAADRELLDLARLSLHGQPTELDIVTRPVGASVRVDDVLLGPTPTSASIRGGHRLVVSMPGFATVTELLPTQPGDRLQRNYELTALPLPTAQAEGDRPAESEAVLEPQQSPKAKTAAAAIATPRSLLAKAQSLRGEGKLRECANVYRQLVANFPSSDEARVALVSLGELSLSVLGEPARALHSFDTYLQQPGPLTREARFGRIRALQMLSRPADAKAAIAAFLRDYPNSVQAERLRQAAKP